MAVCFAVADYPPETEDKLASSMRDICAEGAFIGSRLLTTCIISQCNLISL